MTLLVHAGIIVVSYLLGSIPMGYLMGRLYGVDIRKYGSGKTGGTNLARIVGWSRTWPVAIGDPAKAAVAILLARALTGGNEAVAVLAALATLAGHNWSLYLGFQGGRGVGPVVGALFVFNPLIVIIAGGLGVLIAVVSRYVSLGSICGSALAIVLALAGYANGGVFIEHLLFTVVACTLIIAQHKDNVQRLLAGTERRLGERVQIMPEPPASS